MYIKYIQTFCPNWSERFKQVFGLLWYHGIFEPSCQDILETEMTDGGSDGMMMA